MSQSPDAKNKALRRDAVNALERVVENQRARLFQAHAVLKCLYEVLLHAEGKNAVAYAEAAHLAARLLDECAERLDPVRLRALLDGTQDSIPYPRTEEKLTTGNEGGDDQVRESAPGYFLH
ncbi:MAG TPA: hypothetical protein VJQ52_09780 [Steroidobacteraceae bacterium]|nr:hypothetical protein [Steroidobacteraceae bacterium]